MKPAFLFALSLAIAACGASSSDAEAPVPPCPSPAPLSLAKENAIADTWIVQLDDAVSDVRAEADALATRHAFLIATRLDLVRGFVAKTDDDTIARLRCERAVKQITQERRFNVLAAD